MSLSEKSLRNLIDKWLAPTPASPVHLTRSRLSNTASGEARCVFARSSRLTGTVPLEIMFFRHDDGRWYVYPPATKRPSMRTG
ncbi:hypothetical protein B0G77_3476 [Paraburkholderia sp. BL10I2N1]|nr:hypothetical protein B0G77_3476 [Paraburkholderia sp. BL10I2N1]